MTLNTLLTLKLVAVGGIVIYQVCSGVDHRVTQTTEVNNLCRLKKNGFSDDFCAKIVKLWTRDRQERRLLFIQSIIKHRSPIMRSPKKLSSSMSCKDKSLLDSTESMDRVANTSSIQNGQTGRIID